MRPDLDRIKETLRLNLKHAALYGIVGLMAACTESPQDIPAATQANRPDVPSAPSAPDGSQHTQLAKKPHSTPRSCAASQPGTVTPPRNTPVKIPSASVNIGSDVTYPEERPLRIIDIAAFDIDATEVTNQQFAEFVAQTGYVTDAEKPQAGFDKAGAAVFRPPSAASPTWWHFVEGAFWRAPDGPGSSVTDRDNDPVVQVTLNDAQNYARWADRRLPTEAEWEYAAGGGATTLYVWGDSLTPGGKHKANIWQGPFPVRNTSDDGFSGRAPVGCYAPNAFGLYDMIGNVWEWTESPFHAPKDFTQNNPDAEPVMTLKGGSFLCAQNYCRRYRAAARQAQEAGLPTNHIGFRTVKSRQ